MIGLLIVVILSVALPWGFWMGAQSADKEYDDWFDSSGPGDSITVSGRIKDEEKTAIMGTTIYGYKFKGCDKGFTSSEDIGDEGDIIIVEVEKDSTLGIPEAKMNLATPVAVGPNACCCCLTGTIFLIGGIMIITGLIRGKKKIASKKKGSEE